MSDMRGAIDKELKQAIKACDFAWQCDVLKNKVSMLEAELKTWKKAFRAEASLRESTQEKLEKADAFLITIAKEMPVLAPGIVSFLGKYGAS